MAHLLISIFLLIALLAQDVFATVVCRQSGIGGMDQHKSRALSIISTATTRDMSQAKIYLEFDGTDMYYHSNFVSPGADDASTQLEFPTKIAGNPTDEPRLVDVRAMFMNIVHTAKPDARNAALTEKIYRDQAQFYVDVSIFDEHGQPRVDLSGIKNLHLVDDRAGQSLAVRPELLTTARPPPSLIAKLKGCCLYGRPPHAVPALLHALAEQPLKPDDVRFASLFIDTATESAVRNAPFVRRARLSGDSKALRGAADFSKLMANAKGKPLVMIGHVEGNSYVIRNSRNVETFRIAISEARRLARANQVRLIDIGCETTRAIDTASLGIGVITNTTRSTPSAPWAKAWPMHGRHRTSWPP